MNRPADLPLALGEVLDGKYTVEAVIGHGGMGVVFRARHVDHATTVAIKVMRSEAVSSADAVARFEREARAASALQSEHVARVLDVGRTSRGEPYMAMEHLEGKTLGALMRERGTLPPDEVAEVALGVATALVEAHAMGIVHRDLKPENIFIVTAPSGMPMAKVLDFGIAKVDNAALGGSSLTTTGSVLGTPWYMAPEQLDTRRGVSPKTDVWSLGATMYHALTAKTPFEAESFYELSVKVYAHDPKRITEHRADLPPALVEIIHGCLQKDAKRRLSLEEVVRQLEQVRHEVAGGGPPTRVAPLAVKPGPPPMDTPTMLSPGATGYTTHTAVLAPDAMGPTHATSSSGSASGPSMSASGSSSSSSMSASVPPRVSHASAAAFAQGSGTHNPYITPPLPMAKPSSAQWLVAVGAFVVVIVATSAVVAFKTSSALRRGASSAPAATLPTPAATPTSSATAVTSPSVTSPSPVALPTPQPQPTEPSEPTASTPAEPHGTASARPHGPRKKPAAPATSIPAGAAAASTKDGGALTHER